MLRHILLLLIFPISALSQTKFEIPQLGFSVVAPEGWMAVPSDSLEYSNATIAEFETLFKNAQILVSYYDTSVEQNIYPTLNISVKQKELATGGALMGYAFILDNDFKKLLKNYQPGPMYTLEIGKNKGVVMVSSHDVTDNEGVTVTKHSVSLFIAQGKFLILLNFLGTDYDTNNQVFQAVRQTITMAEPTIGN